MKDQIEAVRAEIQGFQITDAASLEAFRIRFLGSKGKTKDLFAELKSVPNEQKREIGQLLNDLRTEAEEMYSVRKELIDAQTSGKKELDLTRPGDPDPTGARHPLSLVRREIIEIFSRIGFYVSEGPEIEDDWHNFSALNFPPEHPARDMQDTFFVEKGEKEMALRTHTSSVQVRVMESSAPPIRTISPGRVYRNEAISARAHCCFH